MDFRLFGIPIRVQPFFLIIAAFIGWTGRRAGVDEVVGIFVTIPIVFLGVLAHELGHALVGRLYGLSPRIELHGFGGLTSWEQGRMLSPGRSIAVSLAGPMVGILAGIPVLVWMMSAPPEPAVAAFAIEMFVFVNLGWGILNLIPMLPLDGGNILASFFEILSSRWGRLVARYISVGLSVLVILWAIYAQQIFLVVIVGFLAWTNIRALGAEQKVGPDLPVVKRMGPIYTALEASDADTVLREVERLRPEARTPRVKAELVTLAAWAHLIKGAPNAAHQVLAQLPEGQEREPALVGAIHLERGDPEAALEPLERALSRRGGAFVEERLAKALVATGKFDRAAEFFRSARGQKASPELLRAVEEAAYRAGHFRAAATVGEALYDRDADPMRAFNVACSLARAAEPERALEWLERARTSGFDDTALLDRDEDLEPVRRLPDWERFRASFHAH